MHRNKVVELIFFTSKTNWSNYFFLEGCKNHNYHCLILIYHIYSIYQFVLLGDTFPFVYVHLLRILILMLQLITVPEKYPTLFPLQSALHLHLLCYLLSSPTCTEEEDRRRGVTCPCKNQAVRKLFQCATIQLVHTTIKLYYSSLASLEIIHITFFLFMSWKTVYT